MKKYLLFILLLFLILTGCSGSVATVDELSISEKDITDRAEVLKVIEPSHADRAAALADLVKSKLALKIIHSLGYAISTKDLKEEEKRLEKEFPPATLQKVRDLFKDDRKTYMKAFVAVPFSEKVLYQGLFLNKKEIHADRLQLAKDILKKAQESSKSFEEITKDMDVKAGMFKITSKGDLIQYGRNPFNNSSLALNNVHTKKIADAVKTMKKGESYPEVIEWLQGYQIFRFVRKEYDYYLIELVMVSLHNYNDWFWERASKIPVKIRDQKLKDKFLKETPWADKLKVS